MTPNSATTSARAKRPKRRPEPEQSRPRQAPRLPGGALDARVPRLRVRIGSPTSLLAVIPGLLGFDPGHSIVVIGTEPRTAQVRVTLRYDVPDPRHPEMAVALAGHAVSLLEAQGVASVVAVGYGTDAAVSPVAAALRERAASAGMAVTELLRAEGGRYWSYVCADPGCCPPEGTPFDIAGHPAGRALLAAGSQVLADRAALAATLAAADGQLGAAMRRATRESLEQVARCVTRLDDAGMRVTAPRLTATLGQVAVRDAIRRYRSGESIEDRARLAFLAVVLADLRVRDDAWAQMDPRWAGPHTALWTDIVTGAAPEFVPAPASLLAFTAWQAGDGALANVAAERALAADPAYSMALLIGGAVQAGLPPSAARLPMTQEEVAASYD